MIAGVAVNASGGVQGGMGVDAGDLDGDGRPDLLVANFQHEWNNDFRQVRPGIFTDMAGVSGIGPVSRGRLGFSVLLLDADLDGDLDAFVTNGHVWDNVALIEPPTTWGQPNLLMRNDGGRFADVSAGAGEAFGRQDVSRGACLLDLEGDGDLDVAYVNLGARATVLRNDTPRGGRHWLSLRLEQPGPNTRALGARVEVRAGGAVQRRQAWSVRGFLSASERAVQFGLGRATAAGPIRVRWPDGEETDVGSLTVDAGYVVDRRGARRNR